MGADPTWPNRARRSIPCAIMLGSSGGELGSGKAVVAWERTWWRVVRVALCVLLFVLCILLTSIVVVTVPFVCYSVKLPLSSPMNFCLLLSIFLPTSVGGGAVLQPRGSFVADHGQTITLSLSALKSLGWNSLRQ